MAGTSLIGMESCRICKVRMQDLDDDFELTDFRDEPLSAIRSTHSPSSDSPPVLGLPPSPSFYVGGLLCAKSNINRYVVGLVVNEPSTNAMLYASQREKYFLLHLPFLGRGYVSESALGIPPILAHDANSHNGHFLPHCHIRDHRYQIARYT